MASYVKITDWETKEVASICSETIDQMRERHEMEIAKLQGRCPHSNHKRSLYMWAPGHFSNDVEMCSDCGKILKTYDSRTTLGGDVVFSANAEILSSDTVYTAI